MAQGSGLNCDLLTQSLNYHGSELTSLVRRSSVFEELDPKRLNYQIYTKRSKDLVDGRAQRGALHQYVKMAEQINGSSVSSLHPLCIKDKIILTIQLIVYFKIHREQIGGVVRQALWAVLR